MEDNRNKSSGLFGTYGSGDPSLNVPVSSGGNVGLSPYLNFDPAYISSPESQFIYPEGASPRRGRFELAFSQIGGSVLLGGAAGGVNGMYKGLKDTQGLQLQNNIWRSQMTNFVAKQGASSAQSLGVIALMYSIFGVVLSKARGVDDEVNTIAAGTSTGFLYKIAGDVAKPIRGAAVGFAISGAWCIFNNLDRIRHVMDR
jgi:import inner membrane translocase subunit TIM23